MLLIQAIWLGGFSILMGLSGLPGAHSPQHIRSGEFYSSGVILPFSIARQRDQFRGPRAILLTTGSSSFPATPFDLDSAFDYLVKF